MGRIRQAQRSTRRRYLGVVLTLVLVGSAAVAAAHSHADGQQHRQTCATCTVHYQPRDASTPTALPEPAPVELVAAPTSCRRVVRADDFFPASFSRAPPA